MLVMAVLIHLVWLSVPGDEENVKVELAFTMIVPSGRLPWAGGIYRIVKCTGGCRCTADGKCSAL